MPEFQHIRKRIGQINQDIARLEQGLKSMILRFNIGQNYRPVIAEVVTSDFEAVTKELRLMVANTEKLVYERSPKLVINDQSLTRLQE
jgi:hypothetical protein